jgi:signal transduction histidine kinase
LESRSAQNPDFDHTLAGAMSRELHKTAQPLTVLQGLLDLMLERISSGYGSGENDGRAGAEASLDNSNEYKWLIKRAAEEVPRLTGCLEHVRKLAALQCGAGDVDNFPLSPLVTDVLQNLGSEPHAAEVTVAVKESANADSVRVMANASVSRVSAAIRLVLTALVNRLSAGDQIEIIIETDGSNAEIKFRPSRQFATAEQDFLLSSLPSELQFAYLLLGSVGGELRFSKTIDIVALSLPAVASRQVASGEQRKTLHV